MSQRTADGSIGARPKGPVNELREGVPGFGGSVDEMLGNYEEKYKYCESRQFLEEVKQEINKL